MIMMIEVWYMYSNKNCWIGELLMDVADDDDDDAIINIFRMAKHDWKENKERKEKPDLQILNDNLKENTFWKSLQIYQ